MKRSMLWLLPMLSAAVPVTGRELAGSAPDLTIYTQFANLPTALSVEYMKTELNAIVAPLDLHLEWSSLDETDGHQVKAELLVVRFKGTCQINVLPPGLSHAGALGWTHVSDGQILPFTDVDCDRIRNVMESPLTMAVPMERAKLLGRAMARVLAHEIYHFLTNNTKHSSSGIAKPTYSAGELAAQSLRFEAAELEAIRKHRLHPGGEPNFGSP